MVSLLTIVNIRGEMLIYEEYRNDVSFDELNKLIIHITEGKPGKFAPLIKKNGISGHYIRREKLILIAVSKREVSSIAALNFLDRFYGLLRSFCGSVTEEAIEKNFIIVHEIMTECLENGYFQTTNTEQLRSVVYSDPVETLSSSSKKSGPFGLEKKVVPGSAAAKPLVKSRSHQNLKKDEVFVDVIENLCVRFGKDGSISQFYLRGVVLVKNLISRNHSLIICLSEEIQLKTVEDAYSSSAYLDSWNFDDSVDSTNFEKNRSFVVQPSQGEVTVMSYVLQSTIPYQVPFKLKYQIQESETSRDCNVFFKLNCTIPGNTKAVNIVVHIPISSATRSVMQRHSVGDSVAQFIPEENKIKWTIKSLPGNSSVMSQFKLVDAMQCPANKLELGPVSINFEVSNYVCSGMSIKNVHAEDPSKQNIPMMKWIRYVTIADSYMFRI